MEPRLPEHCAHIVRIQRERGRAALAPERLDELAGYHDRPPPPADGEADGEAELLGLLTRPFSRTTDIPRYYRYTDLHVFDWFLDQRPDDQLTGAAEALAVSLTALLAVERAAPAGAIDPATSAERQQRLRAPLDRVAELTFDPAGAVPLGEALRARENDPRARWNRFVLAECTGFPQSDKHDEHLFLRSVHACEMVFFLVRALVLRAAETCAGDRREARTRLRQAVLTAELLNGVFSALWTMSPERFMEFRAETGDASAVQSMNYHAMEIVLYGLDPEKEKVLAEYGHLAELRGILAEEWQAQGARVRAAGDGEMDRHLDALLRVLRRWRGRHYGFAVRYLTPELTGSGGTEGANYLKKFVEKRGLPAPERSRGVRTFLTC
ncbi:tryptophan 2,3-dioxygenase family protein [Kitasatospora sp. NPDC059160]|uniref:tryptophan 2,3-dioxygenase family protein n=1 Tax=Kitasatospora sp. NPDC059160 TaxID=3346748 RepID=UPI00367578B6